MSANQAAEMVSAHDVVRIWAAMQEGKPWAAEQYSLPTFYYQCLEPNIKVSSTAFTTSTRC